MSLWDSAKAGYDSAVSVANDVTEGAAKTAKIPFRGVLWEVDLMDPQNFTLLPMGRAILAAGALYGAFKLMGGR